MAVCAYSEAESLFAMLDVTAADLYYHDTSQAPLCLPGIQSWFHDKQNPFLFQDDDLDGNSDTDSVVDGDTQDDNYQDLMDLLEDADDDLSVTDSQKLMDYRYVSIALSIQEHEKMYVL